MITTTLACWTILTSLLVSLAAYVWLSRKEGSYVNVLTPVFIIQVPANFLLQLVYIFLFSTEFTTFAYVYVYGSLAIVNWAFALAYVRKSWAVKPPNHTYSYQNFTTLSFACLGLSIVIYAPVLFEFRGLLSDPRQIYELTRTGYGQETFVSSTMAYMAVIFILFAKRPWLMKAFVMAVAGIVLVLHGSKEQILNVILLLLLFQVYIRGQKVALLPALLRSLAVAVVIIVLFAVTLPLGGGLVDAVQEVSQYSAYTRNAMLVIDSHVPLQYGRLTLEANVYSFIPRVLMPNKPKDFGPFYLAEEFYPAWFDADTGSPDFGIGVQYADFGLFAMVGLAIFAAFCGWLARIFVMRLTLAQHPSDFLVVAFFAGVSIIPLGSGGWLFPEIIILAAVMRYGSRIGAPCVSRIVKAGQIPAFGSET